MLKYVRVCTISGLMKNMCSSVLFVFNSDYIFFRPGGRFNFRVCIIPSRVSEEMETTPSLASPCAKKSFYNWAEFFFYSFQYLKKKTFKVKKAILKSSDLFF